MTSFTFKDNAFLLHIFKKLINLFIYLISQAQACQFRKLNIGMSGMTTICITQTMLTHTGKDLNSTRISTLYILAVNRKDTIQSFTPIFDVCK